MEKGQPHPEELMEKVRTLESRVRELESGTTALSANDNYQDLYQNLPLGVIIYNTRFEVIYFNQFVVRLFKLENGFTPAYNQLNVFNYVLPEYHDKLRDRFQRLIKGEELDFFELRIRQLDGTLTNIQAKSSAILYKGEPAIQAIFLDTTENKRIEKEKRESDNQLSMILDAVDELVYYVELNPDGSNKGYRYINMQTERILGMSKEDYVNSPQKVIQNGHKEDIAALQDSIRRFSKEKKPAEFIYRFWHEKQKDYIWLEERLFPQIDEKGNHIANLGITRIITDRVNYEHRLKESEALLSMVLNSIDEVVYYLALTNNKRSLKFASDNIEEIVGFTKEEFSNYEGNFLEFIHPDDIGPLSIQQKKSREDKKPAVYNYRFLHRKTDQYIWIEERVFPKFDSDGSFVANFGVTRDITEIKKAELDLKVSEEKFRMLAENAEDIIFRFSLVPEPKCDYMSPSVYTITGYTPEEYYADPFLSYKITHPDDLHLLNDSEERIRNKELNLNPFRASSTLRRIRKDGRIIWTRTRHTPIYNELGSLVALEGITQDITQSRKDEEALRDSEERFRVLSNAAIEGIILSDKGVIIDINNRFLEIFGYNLREEVIGKPVRELIIRDSKTFTANRIPQKGPYSSFEIVCRRKDGAEIFLMASGQNIPYNGKKIRITAINDITERKLAENALKESERTLSTLLGNLPGMAFRCLLDEAWTMQFVNEGCFELTGFRPEDLIRNKKLSYAELIYPDDKTQCRKAVLEAIAHKRRFETQYRIVGDNQQIKWVWQKGEGVFDSSGHLLFLEGFISDITSNKHHELELEKSRESYKNLIESSPDGIFIHDKKGELLFANPSVLKMLGVNSLEEFGPKSIFDYSLPEDLKIYRRRIRQLFEGRDLPFIDTKIRRPNGSILEVESKPILFSYQGKSSILVFCRDISYQRQLEKEQVRAQIAEEANKKLQLEIEQRQRTERQLQTTQKYTRRLIDSSLDMICASDKENFITEFNLAAQRTFGYNAQEVIGKPITFLFQSPRQWTQVYDELINGSAAYAGEIASQKKNGEVFISFLSASVLKNDFGEVIGTMGVSRDISELKKTEEQINIQAAKLNSIIESSTHYIWTFNRDLNLTSFNDNYAQMMFRRYGFMVEVGTHLFKGKFVSTPEHNDFWMIRSLAAFSGIPQNFETSFFHPDTGTTSWMEVFLNPIYGVDKKVNEISGIGHDITEKKLSEEKIRQSLKEKEVLLKEVHHRVKNNLQVISSILNLQSSYVKDRKTLEILRESQNRIKSMAFIHESLYQTKDFSSINFSEYVTNLSNNLVHSYQNFEDQVDLDMKIQDVYLNLDIAIPCGLIINEILSNALKYAFPNNRSGKIHINLSHKDQEITLIIRDNGVGLPAHIDYKNTESLGLQLVVTLVDQLGGSIKLDRVKGTKFTIVFTNPVKNT
jgi:PAS domain S-box-containing protein